MKKLTVNLSTILITIGFLIALIVLALQGAVSFVKKALSDSQSIRVTKKNNCSEVKEGETPYFSGCNSII